MAPPLAGGSLIRNRQPKDSLLTAGCDILFQVSGDALERFVWQTVHKRFYGRRTDWFEHFEGPSVLLWWVPAGHRPGVEEAVARIGI